MSTFGRIISILNIPLLGILSFPLIIAITSPILLIVFLFPIIGLINSVLFYRNRKRSKFKPSRFDSFLAAIPIVIVAIILFFIGSLIVYDLLN